MDMTVSTIRLALALFLFTLGSVLLQVSSHYEFGQMSGCCVYRDFEKVLFEYEIQKIYNKMLIMEYNSTRQNWKGFTEQTILWAEIYNDDPQDAELRSIEMLYLCSNNIHLFKDLKSFFATPTLKVTSVKQSSGTSPALLLCSAYSFYPQDIVLTWLKNGQEVTSGVSSTEVLSDGDLYYQIHSYLEYIPKPGEEMSCMVEHVTLPEPLVQVWDPHPSLPGPEKVKIIVGTVILVIGLTMLVIGWVKHKKRSAALCTTMPGCHMVPVEVVQRTENLANPD